MKKKFWKKEYIGFIAFALAFCFLLLARVSFVFIFISLTLFFGGAVWNLIPSLKHFIKEKKETKILVSNAKKANLQKFEETGSITEEEIKELKKFLRDAKFYVFKQSYNIFLYSAIIVVSVSIFIRSLINLI